MTQATLTRVEGGVARGSDGSVCVLPDFLEVFARTQDNVAGWVMRCPALLVPGRFHGFFMHPGVRMSDVSDAVNQLAASRQRDEQMRKAVAALPPPRPRDFSDAERSPLAARLRALPVGAVVERKMQRKGQRPAWVKCVVTKQTEGYVVVGPLDGPKSTRRVFSFHRPEEMACLRLPFAPDGGTALAGNVFADWLEDSGFPDASAALRAAFPVIDGSPNVAELQERLNS